MDDRFALLTTRQHECLLGKWDRKQDKEIAIELGISTRRVEKHLQSARELLGANSSVEAARMAAAHFGWGSVKPPIGSTELPYIPPFPEYRSQSNDGLAQANAVRDIGWNADFERTSHFGLPLRKGERRNELSTAARSSWIIIIAGGIPATMVLLFALIDPLGRLVGDVARLAH